MRLAVFFALGLACASSGASSQTVPLRRQPVPPGLSGADRPDPLVRPGLPGQDGTLRGTTASRRDADADMARLRSDARLRAREDKARRTLRGICSGC